MNAKRALTAMFLTLISISLIWPAVPAWSQDKKPDDTKRTPQPVSKTKLTVMQGSGDFMQWVESLSIEAPENLTFAWSTDEAGVASARWVVTDRPFSSSDGVKLMQPEVLASGVVGQVPAKGKGKTFNINFVTLLPKTPPKNPKSYWVSLMTKNAQQQEVGQRSKAVRIVYREPSQQMVDLSSIPGEKPKPMPIRISLNRFTVNVTNEGPGDDDPYLFVVAIYADGSTINPFDLKHSSVRLDSPTKTHNNLLMDAYDDEPKTGKPYSIPVSIGHFETGILPLSVSTGLTLQQARNLSRVGILVIVMDEDNTETSAASAGRKAMVNNLQKELDAAIRSMKPPDIPAIQKRITDEVVLAMKKETLKNWWAPWGLFDAANPDDFIGAGFATFSYAQILDAGINGLPITLECKSSEGSYTITGNISRK